MPRVPQFEYLSPEAMRLRRRDGVLPHQVHPAECDDFADWPAGEWPALDEARALRRQIEAADDDA